MRGRLPDAARLPVAWNRAAMTQTLESRIARLEAAEAVRSAFAEYTHYVDGREFDLLADLFTDDAVFDAANFPGGSGTLVRRTGRKDIVAVAKFLPQQIRHHSTNASIDVAADARGAELSAYYLHVHPGGISGGLYEGHFRLEEDGRWRIDRWQVTAGWGLPASAPDCAYSQALSVQTLRAGRPVSWDRTIDG